MNRQKHINLNVNVNVIKIQNIIFVINAKIKVFFTPKIL